jgi:hypothetical protein
MDKLKVNQWLERIYASSGKYQQKPGHYEPTGHFWVGEIEMIRQQALTWGESHKPDVPVIILDCAKVRKLGRTPAAESKAIMQEIVSQFGEKPKKIPTSVPEKARMLDKYAKQRDCRILLLLSPEQLRAQTFTPFSFNFFKYSTSPQWDWILAADSMEKLESLKIANTCIRLFTETLYLDDSSPT